MPIDFSKKIDEVENITREEFQEKYFKPQIPVKIKGLLKDSLAYTKWTPEFFKKELGDIEVGVFDSDKAYLDRAYKTPPETMKFGDYLDLIMAGPTDKRLFLFDVFKYKKELRKDIVFPDIAKLIVKIKPFTFFGGAGAETRIHRDADNNNVFLTEFYGEKKMILFPPENDDILYRYPFSTHTAVEVENPDYEKYPALHNLKGMHTVLKKGETIFMPAKYWHYIKYLTPGIGMSFRSLSSASNVLTGLFYVGVTTHVDDMMRKAKGSKWFDYKTKKAQETASKLI